MPLSYSHSGLKWDAVPTNVNAPNPPPPLDIERKRKPPKTRQELPCKKRKMLIYFTGLLIVVTNRKFGLVKHSTAIMSDCLLYCINIVLQLKLHFKSCYSFFLFPFPQPSRIMFLPLKRML